jgi:mycobactin phenyloxazoline synthetase
VLAAQVCTDDASLTAERIRRRLGELVPAHMVPRHITVVERIGFTDAGKLDRRAAARELETAVLQAQRPGHRRASTPLESALAMIVGDLLGRENVGVDDDFFALGGDSVLATQAVARIRAWLDAPDIIVADIFANRTVSALAAVLSAAENDPGRLDQVAELYLEVIGMDADSVLAASRPPAKSFTAQ